MSRQYLPHTTHTAAHPTSIFSLALHAPSQTLFSASGSSSLQIHSTYSPPYLPDPDSLTPDEEAFPHVQTLTGAHKLGCHHVCASTEGNRAASVGFEGVVRVWVWKGDESDGGGAQGPKKGQWRQEGTVQHDYKPGDIWAIALSSDGRYLASTSIEGRIHVWNLDGSPSTENADSTASTTVEAGAQGGKATTKPARPRSPRKKQPFPADTALGTKIHTYETSKGFGMSIAISPSGTLTATGHQKGALHLFSPSTTRPVSLLSLPGPVRAVKFSPAETLLAAAGDARVIALYAVTSGEQVAILEGHSSWVFDLDWNVTGSLLVSGGWGGEVRVWSTEERRCVWVGRGDEGAGEDNGTGAGKAVWGVRWVKVGRGEGFVCAGRRGDLTWFREAANG